MKNKALVFAGLCTLALCASQVQAVNHETNPIYYDEVDNLPTGYSSLNSKQMKKSLITIAIVLLAVAAQAQIKMHSNGRITFRPLAE